MRAGELLKPNALKLMIFGIFIVFYLYFATENICAVGNVFAFCYKTYGFPFPYLVTGDIDIAFGYIKTLYLGEYFNKSGNSLFNPVALVLDVILLYLLASAIALLLRYAKTKKLKKPKDKLKT